MTSISSIETVTPRSLSPSAPSPSTSASTYGRTWLPDEAGTSATKGKQKEADIPLDQFDSDERFDETDPSTYPPMNDNEAETRQVKENLRRWEVAERQRRKHARDSMQPTSSVLGEITGRASLLLTGRSSQRPTTKDLGTHVPLGSQENVSTAAMEAINASPTPTPSPSPSSSMRSFAESDDPFANPPEPISPFADAYSQKASINTSLDIHLHPSTSNSALLPSPTSSGSRAPPPPRPLDLPPPRTPPPPVDTPHRPTSPPSMTGSREPPEPPREMRWWHDWLCGCNEGPDRGGDYQAGRTNPFE